ncbi:MAG TPA: PIN domain-containing protein [Candidatus Sulfotelmatobacter sp.]|nr:PIN domain-containing protein [Candidatus Sulfotelmatobacter sp.]
MAETYFVDTNILVYAHDRSEGKKHLRARSLVEELWANGDGVLSTQVLQELCINLMGKMAKPFSLAEVREIMQDYLRWRIVVNTPDSILRALELQGRHKISSFWDALIVQAAESAAASVLYSEDLAPGQTYGAVRVVNPFAITA